MVADPADPERTRWQQFTGQSGQPASRHYDDLQQAWLEGRTQPMTGEGPWRELTLEPRAGAPRSSSLPMSSASCSTASALSWLRLTA